MSKIKSIYIIDDDPITVFGIRKLLSSIEASKTVNTFSNGKLAIDNLRQIIENEENLPEVIFLDINMPVMDGWQFLEEFITLPLQNKIRVNIITSSIDLADKEIWESLNSKTPHTITYNNKPISKMEISKITKVA